VTRVEFARRAPEARAEPSAGAGRAPLAGKRDFRRGRLTKVTDHLHRLALFSPASPRSNRNSPHGTRYRQRKREPRARPWEPLCFLLHENGRPLLGDGKTERGLRFAIGSRAYPAELETTKCYDLPELKRGRAPGRRSCALDALPFPDACTSCSWLFSRPRCSPR